MELIDLDTHGLSLVPGPADGPDVTSSLNAGDLAEINCVQVVEALMELEGVTLRSTEVSPESWDWRATLETDEAAIEFRMTLMGEDPVVWGGFGLSGYATRAEIARVAKHLGSRCGSVWIHDAECQMCRPDYFTKGQPK